MRSRRWRHLVAVLVALGASACSAPQTAPDGAPGSLAVRMGGSINSFGGFGSSR